MTRPSASGAAWDGTFTLTITTGSLSPGSSVSLGGEIDTVQVNTPVPVIVQVRSNVSRPLPVFSSVCWNVSVRPGTAVRRRGGDRLTRAACSTEGSYCAVTKPYTCTHGYAR